MSFGVIGLEAQDPATRGGGLAQFALGSQGGAEVVIDQGAVGVEPARRLVGRYCLLPAAEPGERLAQVAMETGLFWVELNGTRQVGKRFFLLAQTQRDEPEQV